MSVNDRILERYESALEYAAATGGDFKRLIKVQPDGSQIAEWAYVTERLDRDGNPIPNSRKGAFGKTKLDAVENHEELSHGNYL